MYYKKASSIDGAFFDTLHNESQLLRAVGMLHLRF